jgi:hypothetical protein
MRYNITFYLPYATRCEDSLMLKNSDRISFSKDTSDWNGANVGILHKCNETRFRKQEVHFCNELNVTKFLKKVHKLFINFLLNYVNLYHNWNRLRNRFKYTTYILTWTFKWYYLIIQIEYYTIWYPLCWY